MHVAVYLPLLPLPLLSPPGAQAGDVHRRNLSAGGVWALGYQA
jgi:hypothetical protein